MSTVVAFRSTAPAVVEAYLDWQREMAGHSERLREFQRLYDPRGVLTMRVRRGLRFVFFEGDSVPAGWRRASTGHIFPDKRLKP